MGLPRPCVPYACRWRGGLRTIRCPGVLLTAFRLRLVIGGFERLSFRWVETLFACGRGGGALSPSPLFIVCFSAVYLLFVCCLPDVVRQSPCCVMRSIAAVRSSVSAPGHPMARTGTRPVASYASPSPARFASYLHPVRVAAVRLRIRLVVWPLPFAGGAYRFVRSDLRPVGFPFDRFSRAGGCFARLMRLGYDRKIPSVQRIEGMFVRGVRPGYSMANVETIVCFSSTRLGLFTVMPNSPAGLSISVSR